MWLYLLNSLDHQKLCKYTYSYTILKVKKKNSILFNMSNKGVGQSVCIMEVAVL